MGLFRVKSRKSLSSDTSSFSKPSPRPPTNNEASDVIGATAEFGSRRGISQASDTSSIVSRNSSSMKKFFGSIRRKDAQSSDVGSSAQPSKAANSDYFNSASSKRASHTSLGKVAAVPNTPPVITPSAIAPSLSTPAGANGSFAEAVGQSVSGALAAPTSPSGPKPSELFAGKGVQWNEIDLTSRDITKPTDAATTSVDLQKFLKERRQWIPTFKDSEAVEEPVVNLPKSLEQFSFDTPTEVTKTSAGLKDLRDLEDTHKRKAALLNPAPLASAPDGTIFEEAGPSTSLVASASGSVAASASQTLPPAPVQPSRNQSFRTSSFAAQNGPAVQKTGSISRKPAPSLGVNGGSAAPSTGASRDIPQRKSSVRKEASDLAEDAGTEGKTETTSAAVDGKAGLDAAQQSGPANGRVDQIKDQAGAAGVASSRPGTANGSVRPSSEMTGFATPAGSQTHDDAQLASSASAALEVPKTPVGSQQEATQDSSATIAPPTSPPRPPKSLSRQNSKEPISNGLPKSSSTSFVPLEAVQTGGNGEAQDAVQAAPALQNVVPGTGAATERQA